MVKFFLMISLIVLGDDYFVGGVSVVKINRGSAPALIRVRTLVQSVDLRIELGRAGPHRLAAWHPNLKRHVSMKLDKVLQYDYLLCIANFSRVSGISIKRWFCRGLIR